MTFQAGCTGVPSDVLSVDAAPASTPKPCRGHGAPAKATFRAILAVPPGSGGHRWWHIGGQPWWRMPASVSDSPIRAAGAHTRSVPRQMPRRAVPLMLIVACCLTQTMTWNGVGHRRTIGDESGREHVATYALGAQPISVVRLRDDGPSPVIPAQSTHDQSIRPPKLLTRAALSGATARCGWAEAPPALRPRPPPQS